MITLSRILFALSLIYSTPLFPIPRGLSLLEHPITKQKIVILHKNTIDLSLQSYLTLYSITFTPELLIYDHCTQTFTNNRQDVINIDFKDLINKAVKTIDSADESLKSLLENLGNRQEKTVFFRYYDDMEETRPEIPLAYTDLQRDPWPKAHHTNYKNVHIITKKIIALFKHVAYFVFNPDKLPLTYTDKEYFGLPSGERKEVIGNIAQKYRKALEKIACFPPAYRDKAKLFIQECYTQMIDSSHELHNAPKSYDEALQNNFFNALYRLKKQAQEINLLYNIYHQYKDKNIIIETDIVDAKIIKKQLIELGYNQIKQYGNDEIQKEALLSFKDIYINDFVTHHHAIRARIYTILEQSIPQIDKKIINFFNKKV